MLLVQSQDETVNFQQLQDTATAIRYGNVISVQGVAVQFAFAIKSAVLFNFPVTSSANLSAYWTGHLGNANQGRYPKTRGRKNGSRRVAVLGSNCCDSS